jgi:hypothetical protein
VVGVPIWTKVAIRSIHMATIIAFLVTIFGSIPFLRDLIRDRNQRLNFVTCFGFVTCVWQGTVPMLSLLTMSSQHFHEMLFDAGISAQQLAIAFGIILIYAVVLRRVDAICGNPISIPMWRVRSYFDMASRPLTCIPYVVGFLAIQVWLVRTGRLGFEGIAVDTGTNSVSPLAQLTPAMAMGTLLIGAYGMIRQGKGAMIVFVVALAVEGVVLGLFGRRMFMAGCAAIIFGLFVADASRRHYLSVLILAVPAVAIQWLSFYALRISANSTNSHDLPSIVGEAEVVLGNQSGEENGETLETSLKANALERVLGGPIYLGMLIGSKSQSSFGANGEIGYSTILLAMPRRLFKNKALFIDATGAEEDIAYRNFQLARLQDEANSVFSTGFTDFKWAGLVIYTVVDLSLIWITVKFMLIVGDPMIRIIILGSIVTLIFNNENCFIDWILLLRDGALWTGIGLVLYYIRRLIAGPDTQGRFGMPMGLGWVAEQGKD